MWSLKRTLDADSRTFEQGLAEAGSRRFGLDDFKERAAGVANREAGGEQAKSYIASDVRAGER